MYEFCETVPLFTYIKNALLSNAFKVTLTYLIIMQYE